MEQKWDIESVFSILNERLTNLAKDTYPLGLAEGKMGICLYFYYLSSLMNNKKYSKIGGVFMEEIYQHIHEIPSLGFEYGLTGIACGIDILVRNGYVEGNINTILEDIDNHILLKTLSDDAQIDSGEEQVYLLYYLCRRMQMQKKNSGEIFIYEELIIKYLNKFYQNLPADFFEEPLSYSLDFLLPKFLYVLSLIHTFDFYNYRTTRIINELSPRILSRLPLLHSNRLFLLWGLLTLKKVTKLKTWDQQIDYFTNNINVNEILFSELRNKNVFINDGIASIYLLLLDVNKAIPHPIKFDLTLIYRKIISSQIWEEYLEINSTIYQPLGLMRGVAGIMLVIKYIEMRLK